MPKFSVEADGYSIEFWGRNGLKYQNQNITLKPIENHRDMIKKAKNEKKHHKTCISEIEVNNVKDCNNAIKESQKILDELSFYLAFAFNHDICFKNFKCYKVKSGSKDFISSSFRSLYVGKMRVGYNISPNGIQKCIDRGFSKFLSEDFNKRTGVRRAILWYNVGRDYNMAEVRFASHFIALEILAGCFANENPLQPRLPNNTYSKFKSELKNLYRKVGIVKGEWENIHSDICGEVQRIHIKEEISALLKFHVFYQYESVAHNFVDLRNKIFHEGQGDTAEEYGGWVTVLKQIERLLVKRILKILDCYDMDELHSSIKKDDLLARI